MTSGGQGEGVEDESSRRGRAEEEPESLKDATRTALLEGRVVLTAVTTLFGFQTNVVFNETFRRELTHDQRLAHLVALSLNAIAIGIVMLPSAYGRQAEPRQVSRRFIRLTSRSMTVTMAPMLLSIAIDFQLIAALILGPGTLPTVLAVALASFFALLWFAFPRLRAHQLAKEGLGPANDPHS